MNLSKGPPEMWLEFMVVFCLIEFSLNLCYLVEAQGNFGQDAALYVDNTWTGSDLNINSDAGSFFPNLKTSTQMQWAAAN